MKFCVKSLYINIFILSLNINIVFFVTFQRLFDDFKILELQNMFFKQVCGFVHGLAGDGIGSKERRSKAPQARAPTATQQALSP